MESLSRTLLAFLLNAAWQVTLVFLLASLMARLLRTAPARYLHALWVVTLGVCTFLPCYSALSMASRSQEVALPQLPVSLVAQTRADALPPLLQNAAQRPVASRSAAVWSSLAAFRDVIRHPVPCPPAVGRGLTFAYALFLLYALGRFVYAWRRKNRLVRGARPLPASPEIERIAESARQAFLLERVRILWSPDAPSPLTAGFRRPVIVLPECLLEERSEAVLVSVMAHEMAHVRRRDFFFNVVFEVLLLPFSFHPAALALRSRIARTREQACDEAVAGRALEAPAYARALLDLARLFSPVRAPRYSVGACDTDALEERIMRIMKLKNLPRSRRARLLLAGGFLAIFAVGLAASAVPLRIQPPPEPKAPALLVKSAAVLPPVAMPAVGPQQSGSPAEQELNLGAELYKSGQIDAAIEHFKRAVELDASLAKAHMYLGTAYANKFMPGATDEENIRYADAAIAEFKKVLDIAPASSNALVGLAAITFQLKRFDEARMWYQRQIDINPQAAEAYYSIGVIDWAQVYQPRMQLKKQLGIAPQDPIEPASVREELCAKNQPRIEEGIRLLKRAVELRPDYQDALAYLNLMYREQADCEATPEARASDISQADQLVKRVLELKRAQGPGLQGGQSPFGPAAPPPPPPPPPPAKLAGAPEGERVGLADNKFQALHCVQCPAPPYPSAANGATGKVTMWVLINKEGFVQNLAVTGSTAQVFTDAATQAVRAWRFRPMLASGQAAFVQAPVTVTFDPSR